MTKDFYQDPLWLKPTSFENEDGLIKKTYLNFERCIPFDSEGARHHNLVQIRKRMVGTVLGKNALEEELQRFQPSFLRVRQFGFANCDFKLILILLSCYSQIDSYSHFGNGIALTMGMAKVWQRPC